jgi:hypothetical protein
MAEKGWINHQMVEFGTNQLKHTRIFSNSVSGWEVSVKYLLSDKKWT